MPTSSTINSTTASNAKSVNAPERVAKGTQKSPPLLNRIADRLAITKEGYYFLAVVIFVFVGAAIRDINLMMLIAGVMVGMVLLNRFVAIKSLKNISLRREIPPVIGAGDTLAIDYKLTNKHAKKTQRSLRLESQIVALSKPLKLQSATAGALCSCLRPKESQKIVSLGELHRRGRYVISPTKMSCRFPFGLAERTVTLGETTELIVYPKLGRMTATWHQLHEASTIGSRTARQQQNVAEGDFHALRGWRPGDSRRWIHWKTSARRGELVVRQFEKQRRQDMLLVVDLWQPQNPSSSERAAVEIVISFVATAVTDLCHRGGGRLVLVLGGRKSRVMEGTASVALQHEALAALATAEPCHLADPALRMAEGLERSPRQSLVLCVSTRKMGTEPFTSNDTEVAERLASLSRKHFVQIEAADKDQPYFVLPEEMSEGESL